MSQAHSAKARKFLVWTVVGVVLVIGISTIVVAVTLRDNSLTKTVTEVLSERLKAEVTLDSLSVHLWPSVRIVGRGLTLVGNYGLRDTGLDFTGTVRLDAPISKVVGGVKGFFLKAVDPLFRKQGSGSVLPIRMVGTLKAPQTSVQMGKVFKN